MRIHLLSGRLIFMLPVSIFRSLLPSLVTEGEGGRQSCFPICPGLFSWAAASMDMQNTVTKIRDRTLHSRTKALSLTCLLGSQVRKKKENMIRYGCLCSMALSQFARKTTATLKISGESRHLYLFSWSWGEKVAFILKNYAALSWMLVLHKVEEFSLCNCLELSNVINLLPWRIVPYQWLIVGLCCWQIGHSVVTIARLSLK